MLNFLNVKKNVEEKERKKRARKTGSFVLLALFAIFAHFSSKACSPLNVPTMIGTPTITATQLLIKWQSTTPYFCSDVIVVEIACNSAAFSGLPAYQFTSTPVTGASNPYTYPTMTINIASLCPGSAYKFRAREQNAPAGASSAWSANFTFTTQGTFVPPTLNLTATPPVICPPQTSQLTANLVNGCGGSGVTYSWAPGASLSCITCSNPIASPTVSTTYTCWATGGQWGCWTASNTVNVGVTTVPPTLGVISANPPVICAGKNTTLTSTSYTGNLQWQQSTSPGGPFTNIAGATTGTYVTGNLTTTMYYQAAVAGCGATLTTAPLTVTVNPTPTVSVNSTSICVGSVANLTANGATSYTWSAGATSTGANTASTSPGTTTSFTVIGATAGCTNQAVSTVTVYPYPVVNIGSNSPVCLGFNLLLTSTGGGTYNWTGPNSFASSVQNPTLVGTTLASAGVYNLTVTANACATMTNINVAIVNPTTSASNTGPYCNGATVQLNASAAVSYTWTGPNGFTSNAQNPTIANSTTLASGVYSVIVTLGSCTAAATTSVLVAPLPGAGAVANSPVCETGTLNLQGSGAGTSFAWTGPSGFSSSLQNPSINVVPASASGVYSLVVTNSFSCTSSTTVNVVINPLPIVTFGGSTVCIGGTASLTAGGGVSYNWTGPNGFSSTLQNPIITNVTAASIGSYPVIIGGANGCTVMATALIGAHPVPTPTASNTGPVCLGEKVNFNGIGGFIYTWTGPNNFVASTQTAVIANADNTAYSGTYTLGVIDSMGCQGFSTTYLLVHDLPKMNIGSPVTSGCIPFCSSFSVDASSPSSIVSATWSTNGTAGVPGFNYSNCFNTDGRYIVTAGFTDNFGCKNTTTLQVNAYPIPVADFNFGPGKPVEENEIYFSDGSVGPGINKWSWFFNSNTQTSTLQHPSYIFQQPGGYAVTLIVQNQWGCKDTITKPVLVGEDYSLFVPDAFSPNGDGVNDIFQPKGHGIVQYSLQVFDRWGEKLFSTTDFPTGWDGSFKGQPCKSDSYVWKIVVYNVFGKSKEYVGHVTLMK